VAKVLIADKLPESCVDVLEAAGFEVLNRPGLGPEDLKAAIKDVDGVIVRSGVTLTEDILAAADKLHVICRAGVGVDNIDVPAASRKGVVVMNTPGANTISTAEHTFALILALSRNVGPAYISMRKGQWDRKQFTGSELSGTTLGIVGLGRVGQAVATRAAAFGMQVIAYDPFISREVAARIGVKVVEELPELLRICDYLTIHVPGHKETRGMIGPKEIAAMKPGARIINCARGDVVDQDAVVEAVSSGHLAGAAFDVYATEPPEAFDFADNDKILATPHLGASTEAAQLAVGIQAAEQVVDALARGNYRNAVNMIAVSREEMDALQPYCELAGRLGSVVAMLGRGRPRSLEISCKGEVAQQNTAPVVNYGVMGVLRVMLGNSVNIVSAPHLAKERGIHVTSSSTTGQEAGFTDLLELKLTTDRGEFEAAGTIFGREHPRIVRVGPFHTEVIPEGHLLLVFAQDTPGLIGSVGDALGRAKVNIARMTFSRQQRAGDAMLALNLDSPCNEQALEGIRSLPLVEEAVMLSF